jgi:hypothetical protein
MRALIVSEGTHEQGRENCEGALSILVRRLLDRATDIRQEKVSDRKVRVHLQPGKTPGYQKRALAWMNFAEKEGFDAVVLVDRSRQGKRSGRSVREMLKRIRGCRYRGRWVWRFERSTPGCWPMKSRCRRRWSTPFQHNRPRKEFQIPNRSPRIYWPKVTDLCRRPRCTRKCRRLPTCRESENAVRRASTRSRVASSKYGPTVKPQAAIP